MNLVCLRNPFLDDGGRFKQHTHFFQTLRYFHDELRVVDVILTHVPVAQVDAALEVTVVGRHVVCADQVVDACTWSAYSRDHVVSRFYVSYVWTNGLNLTKTLMTDDQKIVTRRSLAILGGIDLFVRTIDADA